MPNPPRSVAYLEADQAAGGDLADLLRNWRAEGLSYAAIRDELRDRGAKVSDEAVRAWCLRLVQEAP